MPDLTRYARWRRLWRRWWRRWWRANQRNFGRVGRWLNSHLIWILSWLALVVLVVKFVRSYLDPASKPSHQLVLLGLILAAAALAQSGNDLLKRLTKVGPVELRAAEFVERRFYRIFDELKELPLLETDVEVALSKSLLYEYEKANGYVAHLEWSASTNKAMQDEKVYDLILKMSYVALSQKDWVRTVDRLELLLRISSGKFKPAEAHYRCGLAYKNWAFEDERRREELFEQAHDHLRLAVKENPLHWLGYFHLAYVQVDLGMPEQARQNNEKALEIRPDYAPAKLNLVVCYVLLTNLDAALKELKLIVPSDMSVEKVIKEAFADEELGPLLRDEKRGPEAKLFLESFGFQ